MSRTLPAILTTALALGVAADAPAADRICTTEKGAKGCFQPHGDHFTVSDERADGAKPWVRWETEYGRKGICRPARGRATAHCNYNLRENMGIQFRLELHGGGRFTAYEWVRMTT
jgi:hypothetical protein